MYGLYGYSVLWQFCMMKPFTFAHFSLPGIEMLPGNAAQGLETPALQSLEQALLLRCSPVQRCQSNKCVDFVKGPCLDLYNFQLLLGLGYTQASSSWSLEMWISSENAGSICSFIWLWIDWRVTHSFTSCLILLMDHLFHLFVWFCLSIHWFPFYLLTINVFIHSCIW